MLATFFSLGPRVAFVAFATFATFAASCAAGADDSASTCDLSRLTDAELRSLVDALAPSHAAFDAPDGLPEPRLVLEPPDTVIADPHPWRRGDHRALAIRLVGVACEPSTSDRPAPVAARPATPTEAQIGADALPHPLLGALLVTGEDRGAAADALAWHETFTTLRVAGRHLHAPPAAVVPDAIGALCAGLDPGASAVVVTTGAATPAGEGALILSHEAIAWRDLASALAGACDHLGLLVWVVDASHAAAAADALGASPRAPPSLVWSASDAVAPSASRVDAGDAAGGALSAVLSEVVAERIEAQCLSVARPRPAELAAVFAPDGVWPRIVARRWVRLGEPALARLAAGGALVGASEADRVARYLAAEVPLALARSLGDVAPAGRCDDDAGCRNLAAACALAPCEGLVCEDGRCVPRPAAGASCDDGDSCTTRDRCDALGRCDGDLIACEDDDNPCTSVACEPGLGCVARAVRVACDDGDPCTEGDACDAQGTCVGAAVACDDDDPCTLDQCVPGVGCVHQAARLPCDDGDPCTFADACTQGVCVGTPLACDDGNPCSADRCDPLTTTCASEPVFDGTPCDDGDPCTLADRCGDGICGGLPRVCDDGLACTLDGCDGGACRHEPVPGTCVAGGACVMVGERPADRPCAICVATGVVAPDPALDGAPCGAQSTPECVEDRCAAGVCARFFDADACLDEAGACVGVAEPVTACLRCVGGGVAELAPIGAPCEAQAACAIGACASSGFCVEEPVGCCPTEAIACGAVVEGDGLAVAGRIDAWSCAPGQTWPGPERTWVLEAPCDGEVRVELDGSAGAAVVISRGVDACQGGACAALGAQPAVAVAAGEALAVTLEAPGEGPWTLSVVCACP